ncbi:hypothetical protein TNCV_2109831 [Trichonephila clavipes]|nr:hypothetical protein TNCV_2109831 [Trichonephila clavipes]
MTNRLTNSWLLVRTNYHRQNIGELLSTAYFKAATVGNAVKGFKEYGIEPHNPLVFSEHDFAASKSTDHGVVGDETENNSTNPHAASKPTNLVGGGDETENSSANPQTLIVENQHINKPSRRTRKFYLLIRLLFPVYHWGLSSNFQINVSILHAFQKRIQS